MSHRAAVAPPSTTTAIVEPVTKMPLEEELDGKRVNRPFRRKKPGRTNLVPLYFVAMIGGHALGLYEAGITTLPNRSWKFQMFFGILAVAHVITLSAHVVAWRSDPGFLPRGGARICATDEVCESCEAMTYIRSKHCGDCGGCVRRMDHHCVWIDNCVGAGNQRAFTVFLWALVLDLVSSASLLFLHIVDPNTTSIDVLTVTRARRAGTFSVGLNFQLSLHALVPFVLLLVCFLALPYIFGLSSVVTSNAGRNITTNEAVNRHSDKPRYAHFSSGSRNPFDKGFKANWRAFWYPPDTLQPQYYSYCVQNQMV